MLGLLEDKRNEFKDNNEVSETVPVKSLNNLQKSIVKLIMDKPSITQEESAGSK